MNKSEVFDQIIGETKIDLETRRHSDLLLQNKLANDILIDENKKDFANLKAEKAGKTEKTLKELNNEENELKKTKNHLDSIKKELKRIQQVLVPIEFREIYHPDKS